MSILALNENPVVSFQAFSIVCLYEDSRVYSTVTGTVTKNDFGCCVLHFLPVTEHFFCKAMSKFGGTRATCNHVLKPLGLEI